MIKVILLYLVILWFWKFPRKWFSYFIMRKMNMRTVYSSVRTIFIKSEYFIITSRILRVWLIGSIICVTGAGSVLHEKSLVCAKQGISKQNILCYMFLWLPRSPFYTENIAIKCLMGNIITPVYYFRV